MRLPNFKKSKPISIRDVMLRSTLGLTLGAFLLFILLIILLRMFPALTQSSYTNLYMQNQSEANQLGNYLNTLASSTWTMRDELEEYMNALLNDASLPDLTENSEKLDNYLEFSYDVIKQFLNEKTVTGAFVVLESGYSESGHAALYIRDANPGVKTAENTDFMLLMGPVRLPSLKRIALERTWTYEYYEEDHIEFYNKPLEAYTHMPQTDNRNWGYWSHPYLMSPSDVPIITYSIPLINTEKEFFGVVGLELSKQHFTSLLTGKQLPYENGLFFAGTMDNDAINVDSLLAATPEGNMFLMDYEEYIPAVLVGKENMPIWAHKGNTETLIFAESPLNIYGDQAYFKEDEWSLFAIVPQKELLSVTRNIQVTLFVTLGLAVIASILGARMISKFFSANIEGLAREVENIDPESAVELTSTYVKEIDELSWTVKRLCERIAQNAARMSSIVDMVGISMGAFDWDIQEQRVFLTDSLFRMLEISSGHHEKNYISVDQWNEIISSYQQLNPENETETVFLWKSRTMKERWVRMRSVQEGQHIYGTIIDISNEMEEKKRLQYERDYDPLTGLINRNAYPERIKGLMDTYPGKKGAILFADLDNLKIVNDTYGHDMGDRYIQLTAAALKVFEKVGGIVARIAGDEFLVFIHGRNSKEELRRDIEIYLSQVREHQMTLPDQSEQRVRVSVGVSYYPDDASRLEDLIKYADFAMYEIKHSDKGGTNEFNAFSYERNGYLLHKPSLLDKFLDQGRMRFAFQPIIDANTGGIFGFEALMRPNTREFHSPREVINLAKSQSKLFQLEKIIIHNIFKWVSESKDQIEGKYIFFNSISSQVSDFSEIAGTYDLDENIHIVMEISEEEYSTASFIELKVQEARKNRLLVALDDYGSGFSNQLTLLLIKPDFVKIDNGLVKNIFKDERKLTMVKNIIELSKANGFRVIAEGVEQFKEVEILLGLGVDYLQGFYFCHPQYQLLDELPKNIKTSLLDIKKNN